MHKVCRLIGNKIGITFDGDAYCILVNVIKLLFNVEWAFYTGSAGT